MEDLFEKIKDISCNFDIPGEITGFGEISVGHINKTYYTVYTYEGREKKYILQNVNTTVFKNPEELMSNIIKVTSFLRRKIAACGGDEERETLTLYPTKSGKYYYHAPNGECWRVYNYVDNSFSYNSIESPEIFYSAGEAFGGFMGLLADFPMGELYETIPDFHDTRKRVGAFEEAVKADTESRAASALEEIDYVRSVADRTGIIVDLLNENKIPLRVTHNDTKLNNVMFDLDTKKAVCVVDLDTVMPGSALYDFGDAIRYGANTGAEDERDLDKVNIDVDLYRQYVRGYMSKAAGSLTELEVEYLPLSAWMMTFECGMRFLTDYLSGDTYFGKSYDEHNLVRCRSQFKLAQDIDRNFELLKDITNKAYNEFK